MRSKQQVNLKSVKITRIVAFVTILWLFYTKLPAQNPPEVPVLLPCSVAQVAPSLQTPSSRLDPKIITTDVPGLSSPVEVLRVEDLPARNVVGQKVCVQGVINKTYFQGLADSSARFFVVLSQGVLCEFMTVPFLKVITDDNHGVLPFPPPSVPANQLYLRIEDSGLAIYSRYPGRKCGIMFLPGDTILAYGNYNGLTLLDGAKMLLISKCILIPPDYVNK